MEQLGKSMRGPLDLQTFVSVVEVRYAYFKTFTSVHMECKFALLNIMRCL